MAKKKTRKSAAGKKRSVGTALTGPIKKLVKKLVKKASKPKTAKKPKAAAKS